jgi:3-hydroxyisobutyrate dehydrogenase-like beta-hydroxyacid dehydrogenase
MKQRVGVIGLGIMGSAMSANLAKAGFEVQGYDVIPARRAALKRAGGKPMSSLSAIRADVIITSLPSADALHAVSQQLKRKAVVVETSTLPIEDKEQARDTLKRKGIVLLDCPLSGTGAQAKTGDLVVFGSGDRSAFTKTLPVLKGFSRARHYVGAQVAAEELAQREQECPACAAQRRAHRRHWALIVLAAIGLLSGVVASCWGSP